MLTVGLVAHSYPVVGESDVCAWIWILCDPADSADGESTQELKPQSAVFFPSTYSTSYQERPLHWVVELLSATTVSAVMVAPLIGELIVIVCGSAAGVEVGVAVGKRLVRRAQALVLNGNIRAKAARPETIVK